jgi:hypothetical protein
MSRSPRNKRLISRRSNALRCAFHKLVASKPISTSEFEIVERNLARLVALAYASDHPDLFTPGTDEAADGPPPASSAVTLLAQMAPPGRSLII